MPITSRKSLMSSDTWATHEEIFCLSLSPEHCDCWIMILMKLFLMIKRWNTHSSLLPQAASQLLSGCTQLILHLTRFYTLLRAQSLFHIFEFSHQAHFRHFSTGKDKFLPTCFSRSKHRTPFSLARALLLAEPASCRFLQVPFHISSWTQPYHNNHWRSSRSQILFRYPTRISEFLSNYIEFRRVLNASFLIKKLFSLDLLVFLCSEGINFAEPFPEIVKSFLLFEELWLREKWDTLKLGQ